MLWLKLVDYVETPFATNNLVVRTNLLYTCTHFHADHCSLLMVNDTLLNIMIGGR
jgi:hypothetical protein